MSGIPRGNLLVGAVSVALALVLAFVWIPLDTGSGVVETVRRKLVIGDAMAPTVAAMFLLLGGMLLLTFERRAPGQPVIFRATVIFALQTAALLGLGLLVMRWSGPLAAMLAGEEYRLLRDSYPWKLTGYVLGGVLIVAGLVARGEHRLGLKAVAVAVLAVLLFVALYDLPFDDLLLPPNGDV